MPTYEWLSLTERDYAGGELLLFALELDESPPPPPPSPERRAPLSTDRTERHVRARSASFEAIDVVSLCGSLTRHYIERT